MPLNHGRLHKWSLQVRAERGNKCALCGGEPDGTYYKRIEAHHIEPKDSRPDIIYDPRNGVPLCRKCHRYAHGGVYDLDLDRYPNLKQEIIKCVEDHGWTHPANPPLQVYVSPKE